MQEKCCRGKCSALALICSVLLLLELRKSLLLYMLDDASEDDTVSAKLLLEEVIGMRFDDLLVELSLNYS